MSDIDELESLVLDDDFQELSRILKSRPPNIFRILDIEANEVRWSAFLAWLLDPNEDHGLGDRFLRDFLTDVQKHSGDRRPRPIDAHLMDLSQIEVETEEPFKLDDQDGRFDIVIRSLGTERRLCIIENKVRSEEGLDQTNLYFRAGEEIRKREDLNRDPIHVFLSLRGQEPACKRFSSYSYSRLVAVLERILKSNGEAHSQASTLIEQFIQNIKDVLGEEGIKMEESEKEVRDLCLRIHSKHKKTVEKLIRYQPTWGEFFKDLAASLSQHLPNRFSVYHDGNLRNNEYGLTLSPRDWKECTKKYSHVNYFIFNKENGNLVFSLWACREDGHLPERGELEREVQKLFNSLPEDDVETNGTKRGCGDTGWENIIVHRDTGITLPTDFSQWPDKVKEVKERFLKFLGLFKIEKIEEVPGVKRP